LHGIITSEKHATGKNRVEAKEKRERNIVDMLKSHDKEVHPSGKTLPDSVQVYRVKVVTAFMKAGTPI
jgi:hypothetical protein